MVVGTRADTSKPGRPRPLRNRPGKRRAGRADELESLAISLAAEGVVLHPRQAGDPAQGDWAPCCSTAWLDSATVEFQLGQTPYERGPRIALDADGME